MHWLTLYDPSDGEPYGQTCDCDLEDACRMVAEIHAAAIGADRAATAVSLVEQALHLRMLGERAPGGTETWAGWDKAAEAFLRERQGAANG